MELLRSLRRNRRLLFDFVSRDLRARYVGSSMGFFWSVVYPFLNLLIYMFVFSVVLGARFEGDNNKEQVALWMLAGIMVWTAFGETVSRATNTLVENQNLIQKVVFPSEVLPIYLCISSLINMCIGLPIVLLGVAAFMWFPDMLGAPQEAQRPLALGLSLCALPLLFLLQGMLTVGLGYLFSTLNLFLRDVYHLVGVFITIWMFSTPIFYPPKLVATAHDGKYAWMLDVNPMHWLITCYREILIFGEWPDWLLLGRFALVAFAILWVGARLFMSQKPHFPDLL